MERSSCEFLMYKLLTFQGLSRFIYVGMIQIHAVIFSCDTKHPWIDNVFARSESQKKWPKWRNKGCPLPIVVSNREGTTVAELACAHNGKILQHIFSQNNIIRPLDGLAGFQDPVAGRRSAGPWHPASPAH